MTRTRRSSVTRAAGFLEASTLGLGALIGGIVTVPALGFMVAPAFVNQSEKDVDLGPLDNFPEGQCVIATFLRDPEARARCRGGRHTSATTASSDGVPSFTIISNRCAHLGCPVQPSGPVSDEDAKKVNPGTPSARSRSSRCSPPASAARATAAQYDTEGNRTAGPPVRALDRYEFEISNGHLVLLGTYSVSYVDGEPGAAAKIHKHTIAGPGQHVDGLECCSTRCSRRTDGHAADEAGNS